MVCTINGKAQTLDTAAERPLLEVLREDLATMETNLQAIASGALPHIVLSQQEMLIQNHYRAADELLQGK